MLLPLLYERIVLQDEKVARDIYRNLARYPWLLDCVHSLTCLPPDRPIHSPSVSNALEQVPSLLGQLSKLEAFTWKALDTVSEKMWKALREK